MWSSIRVLYFLLALFLGAFSGHRNDVSLRLLVGVGLAALFRVDLDNDHLDYSDHFRKPMGYAEQDLKYRNAERAKDAIISLLLYLAGFALYRYAHRAHAHNA
jgi:hypothetical protein